MSTTSRKGLSKSRFVAGLQCLKQLWWRAHDQAAPELQAGPELQAVFDRGHRVGAAARERFPGGVLIDLPHDDIQGRVEATAQALANGTRVIYEASFLQDDVFVAVDVLERQLGGFTLVEVKSTLDVKPPHVPDVAVQLHVLRRAGLDVGRAELMHLNRDCRHPDLSNLFVREDVTDKAEEFLPSVAASICSMQSALQGLLPEIAIGAHCTEPYECPFIDRCWPPLPDHHIRTLHGLREQRIEELIEAGFETIHQLPDDLELRPTAARQVRSVRSGDLVVEPGLGDALSTTVAPVAFLDFETIAPAIPVWPGCQPYGIVPVQMSCHVQGEDGQLAHHGFLAEGPGDPRPAIARAVVDACAGAGTVVAYGASFELRCLDHLAAAVPDLATELHQVCDRVVDLLGIVRDNVYHPGFGGSFSIKSVLPALVPGLGYGDLVIADGAVASARLESLLLGEDAMQEDDRQALRRDLLAYCGRDTLAMVKLWERLRTLASSL
jgi:predicted RecB family nuclease